MKHLARTLITVIILIVVCAASLADTINVSTLSDAELLNLYTSVTQEMNQRGLSGKVSYNLAEGKYIIGQDVLPGKYTLTCIGTSGEEIGNAYSSLGSILGSLGDSDGTNYGNLMGSLGGLMSDLVNTEVKIIGDYGSVIKSYELKKDQSIQITLEEKTAIQIEDGNCILEPIY